MPLVSTFPIDIPIWNKWVDDHIISIFDFVDKFRVSDEVILLFHLDDPWIIKEIKSYLESYSFHICMEWVVLTSSHLLAQNTLPWKYKSTLCPLFSFFLSLHPSFSHNSIFFHVNYDIPHWAKLLFWWKIMASHLPIWGPFYSALHLKSSYKRGSMFEMRMSFTTRQTHFPWLNLRMEGHFMWPRRCIL